jgi:SAM-dependent methyltransferase
MDWDATVDWDSHWTSTDRSALGEMRAAGRRTADRLERYLDPFPSSLASVGCGPAFALFALADDHPEVALVGYDAAGPVLEENRALAADRGLENLAFRRAALPGFDPDRRFGCVVCLATLHYVEAIERAVEALFDAVAPDGTLVFNYPNGHTRETYREDPDTDQRRFRLLLEGRNLLTESDIERLLDREVRSFWRAVDLEDWRSVHRSNPCVVVEK